MADVKAKIQQSSDGTTATVDTQTNTVNTTTRSAFVIAYSKHNNQIRLCDREKT
jgi:hypothetical protein